MKKIMKKVICLIAIVLLVLTGYSVLVPGKITVEQSKDNNEITFTSSKKFKIKKLYAYTGTNIDYYGVLTSYVDVNGNSYTMKYDDSSFKVNNGKGQIAFDELNNEYQECKVENNAASFKDDNSIVPICEITYSNPKDESLPSTKVVTVTATVENKWSVVWLIDGVILFAIAVYYAWKFTNVRTDPVQRAKEKNYADTTLRGYIRRLGR